MPIGRSIATAVNTVKRWCAGGGVTKGGASASNVTAATKAKACRAVGQWEAKKAKGKVSEALALIEEEGALRLVEGGLSELSFEEVGELLASIEGREDEIDRLGVEEPSVLDQRLAEATREMERARADGDSVGWEGARARAAVIRGMLGR